MGKAERRKGNTPEDRMQFALNRKAEIQKEIEEKSEARIVAEVTGWKTMTWWQIEMTVERMERIAHYEHRRMMKMASFRALLAGTIYSTMGGMYAGCR